MENSKQWQDNSDGWVTAMNASKEMKEKYNIYMKEELKKSEGKIRERAGGSASQARSTKGAGIGNVASSSRGIQTADTGERAGGSAREARGTKGTGNGGG